MNTTAKNIYQAIRKNQWLSIKYRNKNSDVKNYWIAIEGIDPIKRSLSVQAMSLKTLSVKKFDKIYIDSILSSSIIEGSYHESKKTLVDDLQNNDHKYHSIFGSVANLKTLSYLEDCNRFDVVPYVSEYALISRIDGDSFKDNKIILSDQQFSHIVSTFQKGAKENRSYAGSPTTRMQQIALNVLSVYTQKGLYVLAYRPLFLNVVDRELIGGDMSFCTEFIVESNGVRSKQGIRKFLDEESFALLEDFDKNAELIKDRVMRSRKTPLRIDDRPYLIALGRDNIVDLRSEYAAIHEMYNQKTPTYPIRAFFGELTKRPIRKKDYPLILLDEKINLDQVLAINKAIKYPLAYIQGPPGTGKTTTIINTILNAFFNGSTVLFASNNNHPVNGVFNGLKSFAYHGRPIPLPVIRLGHMEYQNEALDYIKELHSAVADLKIYESSLNKKKESEIERAKKLNTLLARYEERLDLLETRECIESLVETSGNFNFSTALQSAQLASIDGRLAEMEQLDIKDILPLMNTDKEELSKFLYYTSARYLKRLNEPKNAALLEIVYSEDNAKNRAAAFNKYLSNPDNLKNFLRIFPVVVTTCISSRRLGEPRPSFDMTILDEASQCNIASSLIPIIRGENLMLVGDPQQLNPVVVLDPAINERLKRNYGVLDAYDYREMSIYKTFLACDAVSDEILLSHHYRCDERIIGFNNRKYYNGKLKIKSKPKSTEALEYYCVPFSSSHTKNTAPAEVDAVLDYIKKHPYENVGIITPFSNQRDLLKETLKSNGALSVPCGTVHAFQGDETDTILFSLALTDKTSEGTYAWLATNRELINVATSRARKKLVLIANQEEVEKLHSRVTGTDDIYELVQYVKSNGQTKVTEQTMATRALGIKPYSTKTENAFLESLNHALDNIFLSMSKFVIHKEVPLSQVFSEDFDHKHLFYTGRFDFVVYEKVSKEKELPVLAIELDGKEHYDDDEVKRRDREKNKICESQGLSLIRVDNSYARRYNHIKNILIKYFEKA